MATLTLSPSLATSCPRARTGARPAAQRRTPAGPVRLTRRGRLVLTIAVALATLMVGVLTALMWSTLAADPAEAGDGAGVTYVVTAGDTLWSIAAEVAGTGDVRAVMYEIKQANGLTGGAVVPGQVLDLPTP